MEMCAVCKCVIDEEPNGIGTMLFHRGCTPSCRFCGVIYELDTSGWDFRGEIGWSNEWGYLQLLRSAVCPECSDTGGRRDYGSGW